MSAALILSQVLPASAADEGKSIAVAPGESIQQAIDRAPAGAVIRLGEGEWKERIVITKPLTLEGAGWEKTLLRPDKHDDEALKRYAALSVRGNAITSPEEMKKFRRESEIVGEPTVTVRNTAGVTIRGVKIQGMPVESDVKNGLDSKMLFLAQQAKAAIADCVFSGYHCGIMIPSGSEVEVRRTLIAGLWNYGVNVQEGGKLRLIESDVRNCYYAGVVIGRGSDAVLIDKCRISGAAWHGIRYDDASPTITNNVIFGNARAGIYASGTTKATVAGNLFWKSEGAGMGCVFDTQDTIEQNTFVENAQVGLSVSGGGNPLVRRNVFSNQPVAIQCGTVRDKHPKAGVVGQPQLEGNIFWGNPQKFMSDKDEQPLPAGNVEDDPQFRDNAAHEFALALSSPARGANTGVAKPLDISSPWPLLAEEKAIIPVEETRDSRSWSAPGGAKPSKRAEELVQKAHADAKAWVADAFQLDDTAKRMAAIESIRAAMKSGDVNDVRKGILAFGQLGPIEFDKASFRPAVRELLKSADVPTRAAAARAVAICGADAEDLPRVFALADDPAPEVREPLTGIIVQLTNHDLTAQAASEAILKLMNNLPRDSRSVAHALWGSKFSPEIETRVLEFCREIDHASNSSVGYNFFYGALSTQANKREASCQRLIELLAHQDTTNIAGRSAWGLQQGVERAQYPLVAVAMVKVIEARSDGYLRNNALRCLRTYGDAAQAPALRALLAKPGVTGDLRKMLEETVAALELRPVGETSEPPKVVSPARPAGAEKGEETRAAQLVARNRAAARLRAADDRRTYTPEQLQEIETLYQVANTKGKRTEEAKASLKQLLEKYDKANRTGCATLYLGQASGGAERLEYLTRAVEKFSDCYYFNGCQVGGYGRYVFALTLWEKGEKEKAGALLGELKTTYKDATDHRGKPMGEIAEAAEKELEARK